MGELLAIYETVRQHTDDIIRRWAQHIDEAPWLGLPAEAKIDHVPELLEATIDVLVGRPGARERVIRIGIRHGRHRRENGFDDGLLYREHYLLRSAVWDVIRELPASPNERFAAIARFDVVLTHTTTASLYGFHLAGGRSPASEDQVVARLRDADAPWPPAPD